MSMLTRPYTESDLEQEREATTDRVELIAGDIVVTPAPTLTHQRIAGRLYTMFEQALPEQVYFAPLDVKLAEFTIVQPDVVVITPDRASIMTDPRIIGAPTIVAEIVSPSTSPRDALIKRDLYASHGVPEYWHVDPVVRRVTVFSDPVDGLYHVANTYEDEAVSATVAGLSADLRLLFRPVPGI